jgi:hypothetical protein
MAKPKEKKHGRGRNGNKTHGRNKSWCESYFRRGQRLKNKKARLRKHIMKHPNDKVANERLSQNS